MEGWQSRGNVTLGSYSNCPSATVNAADGTKISKENKICVSNSTSAFWDGKYQFQYYDTISGAAVYVHTDENKYLHGSITKTGDYQYFINDYETHTTTIAHCLISHQSTHKIFDIYDCVGKWEQYFNGTWNKDTTMVAVPCQDICVDGSYASWINGGKFEWLYYDRNQKTNVYLCEECVDPNGKLMYLYGRIIGDVFRLDIGFEERNGYSWCTCMIGDIYYVKNDYKFSVDDCSRWSCWNGEYWQNDLGMRVSKCWLNPSTPSEIWSSLAIFQESKLCVSSSHSNLNGEYVWIYYDTLIDGSGYYNAENKGFIYPRVIDSEDYQLNIQTESIAKARCNISTVSVGYIFDINDCFFKWEIYENFQWVLDSNLFVMKCQDICFTGHDVSFAQEEAVFKYQSFDNETRSNMYICADCEGSFAGYVTKGAILSVSFPTIGAIWSISPMRSSAWIEDRKIDALWCYTSYDLYLDKSKYVFDIDDCLDGKAVWIELTYTLNDSAPSAEVTTLVGSKCNAYVWPNICGQFAQDSKLSKTYLIKSAYHGFAIGADVHGIQVNNNDKLTIRFSCNASNISHVLTTLDETNLVDYEPVMNFLYKLPKNCDNSSTIDITFETKNAINSKIYVDNVYLYYGIKNVAFTDEMKKTTNWKTFSKYVTVGFESNEYCQNDGLCCKLNVSSMSDFVYIIGTANLGTEHKYKDFHLEFSFITSGLHNDSFFKVEIQCDKNVLYLNQLCQKYNATNDCTDYHCMVQSFNLPAECDFSSQVMMKFYFESSFISDNIYMDYVHLTHSDSSGKQYLSSCRSETAISLPTKTIQTGYSYVYYDPMHTLSNWKVNGTVSSISSPNCPSMTNDTSLFAGNKICVSDSYESFWDGKYEWQYFDENMNGSIYYNNRTNKYIYEIIVEDNYEYYMNDYATETMLSRKCITDRMNGIRNCNQKWTTFDNNSSMDDVNMITTQCNDICIYGANPDWISTGAKFVWSHFLKERRTNVYYCQQHNLYLFGRSIGEGDYSWIISPDYLDTTFGTIHRCNVGSNKPEHYIFDVDDCLYVNGAKWETYVSDKWNTDSGVQLTKCFSSSTDAQRTLSTLPIAQESQICIQNSDSLSLNGIYKWLHFDLELDASIYYNAQNKLFMYPSVNLLGHRKYKIYDHIHSYTSNMTILAMCNLTVLDFYIVDCIGRWQLYSNNSQWYIDNTMISTPCQDVCIHGYDGGHGYTADWLNNGRFIYLYYQGISAAKTP
eukprot:345110_1